MVVNPKRMAQLLPNKLLRTLFVVLAGAVFAVALGAFVTPDAVAALKAKVRYPLMVFYAELSGSIARGADVHRLSHPRENEGARRSHADHHVPDFGARAR